MSLHTPPLTPGETTSAATTGPADGTDLLSVEIDLRDGVAVATASGEIDLATGPLLRDSLRGLLAAGHTSILVDLDAVTFIDSTGIGTLIAAYRAVGHRSGELGLVCNNSLCRRLLDMAGLHRVFTFHASQDAGVAAMTAAR